jgi:hypothetical protein
VCLCVCVFVQWCVCSMVCLFNGVFVQWCVCSMVCLFNGVFVQIQSNYSHRYKRDLTGMVATSPENNIVK